MNVYSVLAMIEFFVGGFDIVNSFRNWSRKGYAIQLLCNGLALIGLGICFWFQSFR